MQHLLKQSFDFRRQNYRFTDGGCTQHSEINTRKWMGESFRDDIAPSSIVTGDGNL